MKRLRVMHFGSGGGKGVTRVVTELVLGHADGQRIEPFAISRQKHGKPLDRRFADALDAAGVMWDEVMPSPRSRTIAELRQLIREFKPDVFVAHGYSEHIWGRRAALAEQVPHIVHAEHAHERYSRPHLKELSTLNRGTSVVVAVSEGVRTRLLQLGIPQAKTRVIHNGLAVERFAGVPPLAQRKREVLMVSRFASAKDHTTLIKALGLLKRRGVEIPLTLAGDGKWIYKWSVRLLVAILGLGRSVKFLGHVDDVPTLLGHYRVVAFATKREGFGLVVIEALLAGCAVVTSRIPGIDELIVHGQTGFLSDPACPESMAEGIVRALGQEGAEWAARGPSIARERFSLQRMTANYENLFKELVGEGV
ncbi:MAG: glycosyltransferase family 4 protein [Gammaproteobacteria bacterium]|nr:glycosyltransferase family 4 protein [Gammaproteobacteria bacterium]